MAFINLNTEQGLAKALAFAVALGTEDAKHKRPKLTGKSIRDMLRKGNDLSYRNGHIAFLRNSYMAGYWSFTVNHEEEMTKLKKEFQDLK